MTTLSTRSRPAAKPTTTAIAKPARSKPSRAADKSRSQRTPAANGEVLTLAETAALLRVSEDAIQELVDLGELPAKRVAQELRFSKSAVMSWLSTPSRPQGNAAFIALAGAFKDDPYLEEMVEEIYRQRGRPMTEAD